MRLILRRTKSFLEIKVDEIDVTIFDGHSTEIQEMIIDATELLEHLYDMQGLDVEIKTFKQ
jgi:hypothetical protein